MNSRQDASSPLRIFESNIRPALLLVRVYRLLNSDDRVQTDGQMIANLRALVGANSSEHLMLIYNELFLGLVRECAYLPHQDLHRAALSDLLRQAIVVSCTALETYLMVLLQWNLQVMIRARGVEFMRKGDKDLQQYFNQLKFGLEETLSLVAGYPEAPKQIADKILSQTIFNKSLTGSVGVIVVGKLLGLTQPMDEIASRLTRDPNGLARMLEETVERRNAIIHRADRPKDGLAGERQSIDLEWTTQAVDTMNHVCLTLNALVTEKSEEIHLAWREREQMFD